MKKTEISMETKQQIVELPKREFKTPRLLILMPIL
jgi:hypothetical protein